MNAPRQSLEESWNKMSLVEQLGNIGSEVGRAAKVHDRNDVDFSGATTRALELFDLTLRDKRWLGRLREIGRVREVFCDIIFGDKQYQTTLSDLENYFLNFAMLARMQFVK